MKKWIILFLLLSFIVIIILILGNEFIEIQYAKSTVISFGRAIHKKDVEELGSFFLPKGVFIHGNDELHYNKALEILSKNIKKVFFEADLYGGEIKGRTKNQLMIAYTGWFSVNGNSQEASGFITLKKVGFWNWRIKEISSNTWVFGYVFFDKK